MNEERNPLRRTDFPQMPANEIPECEGKPRRTCMHTPRCQYFSDTCIPTPRQLVANQIHGRQGEVERTISIISGIPVDTVRAKFNTAMGKSQDDTTANSPNQNRWFATKIISKIQKKGEDGYPADVDSGKKWTRAEKPILKSYIEQELEQDVCFCCLEGPEDDRPLEQMNCCGLLSHEECASEFFNTRPNAVCPTCRAPRPDGPIQAGFDPHAVVFALPDVEVDPELHDPEDLPYIVIGNPGPIVEIDNANGFFSFENIAEPIVSDEDLAGIGGVNYSSNDHGNCITGNIHFDNSCRVDIDFAIMISKVCIDADIVEFGMDVKMSRYVRELFHEVGNIPNSVMFREGQNYHHVDIDMYNDDHILVLRQARTCASFSNISTVFNGGRFPKLSRTGGENMSLLLGPVIVKNKSSLPLDLENINSQITSSNIYSLKTNNVSSNEVTLGYLFEEWKDSFLHDIQIQGVTGPVQETMIQFANGAEWERYDQDLNGEPYSIRLINQNHRTIQYYNNSSMLKLTNSNRDRYASS